MKSNPEQQKERDSLEPWKKALNKSYTCTIGWEKRFMMEAWLLADTAFAALVVFYDISERGAPVTYGEFLDRALELGNKDELEYFIRCILERYSEEALRFLDRFLELCEYIEDVEKEMARVINDDFTLPNLQEYLARLISRVFELPHRP